MLNYKQKIIDEIKKVFPELIESSISIPPDNKLGDFAIPCQPYSKKFGNPSNATKELKEIVDNISKLKELIFETKIVGPYVNIFLKKDKVINDVLNEISLNGENYSKNKNKETIVIDYSQPNVAKNMGLHNLRSTVIGQALYNTYKYLGYNVIGVNHLGDWGTQFGKLIWALEKWSSFEELKEKGIFFLNQMYVRFHELAEKDETGKMDEEAREWFKKIELGDPIAQKWWKIFVDVSMEDYNKLYDRLNISFDFVTGESFYIPFLDESIKKLKEKKLVSLSEGALVVAFDEEEKMPPCLLRKSDGATLYGTRDIAAIFYRLEKFNPNKILYVVDVAQELHFKQVFKVMELYDSSIKEKLEHVVFGRLSFKDGQMSTRKGNVILLREVLDKAKEKVLEIIKEKNPDLENKEEVAEIVGSGAVVFGDLINDRIHNVIFDWDKILDFQGETAPYIQYSYARLKSILRKEESKEFNAKNLTEEIEYLLVKKINEFGEILDTVVKQNKPSILCKYLIEFCQLANSYYVKVPILKEDIEDKKKSRLFLIKQITTLIKISAKIINIKVPEEM